MGVIGWQRVEGFALFLLAVGLFWDTGYPWWLFLLLWLVPDLSMAGYLANPRTGAMVYNLGHVLVGPAVLLGWGLLAPSDLVTMLGAVWLAHVGGDRALGYGLKHPTSFQDTHLGAIGRKGQLAVKPTTNPNTVAIDAAVIRNELQVHPR